MQNLIGKEQEEFYVDFEKHVFLILMCTIDKIEMNGTNTILKKFREDLVRWLSGKGACHHA